MLPCVLREQCRYDLYRSISEHARGIAGGCYQACRNRGLSVSVRLSSVPVCCVLAEGSGVALEIYVNASHTAVSVSLQAWKFASAQ